MVGRSSPKLKFETFDQVIKEIERCQGLLSLYEKEDPALPTDFNYKETMYTLRYCCLIKNSWKKSERKI
jgi:hypothetical protein